MLFKKIELMEKWKFWFVFHNKCDTFHHKYFNLIYCFHDQGSHFIAYSSIRLIVIKPKCQICNKNNITKNYEKCRNCISRMRDLNHFVLGKGFLPSVKGHLSFTKGHSDNPQGQLENEAHLIRSYFWKV